METADARTLTGRLVSIEDGKVVIRTDDGDQTLAMTDLVQMSNGEEPEDIMTIPGQAVLQTAQGDALAVADVAFDGRKLTASGRVVGKVAMPIDAARAILLPAVNRTAGELLKGYERLELSAPAGDRLVVTREGKQDLPVDGVLEGIDADKISFRWNDASRTISRKSVPMIFLATVASKAARPAGTVVTRDSSRVRFSSLSLADGRLVLESPAMGRLSLKLADVVTIGFSSANVVRLSSLKPSSVTERGEFSLAFRHRKNKSVGGKAMTMGGKQYATGLGLHSECELVYDLAGEYSSFVAVVGIDDEARPHGDAMVTFLGDDKQLGDAIRVTGKGDPHPVRLDVRGVKKLTIRVGFGLDGLGIGDHVDLAGARLIK